MGQPRNSRRRVEDALSIRIGDVVPRRRSAFGCPISGDLTARDPRTGVVTGTIAFSGELRGGYGRIAVTHTPAGQRWPEPAYVVSIIAVDHPFGPRLRFRCPVSGALVDALYLPAGADQFASRLAHGLSYATQSMRAPRRAEARARRIRTALGGTPDLGAPFPERPPRMWMRTWLRRRAEAGAGAEESHVVGAR